MRPSVRAWRLAWEGVKHGGGWRALWPLKVAHQRYIQEGQMIPWGYGVAWYDPITDCACCLPLGINVVAHYLRRAYHWLKIQRTPSLLDAAMERGRSMEREYRRRMDSKWDEEINRLMASVMKESL